MPDSTAEAVIFSSAVEGFVKSLGGKFPIHLREEFTKLGINLDQPAPAYTLDVWERAMRLVAQDLHADEPENERYRIMGRDFIKGYIQTAFGKAALAFTRLIGPRRTLHRMSHNFRSAANYIGCEAKDLGPRHVELRTWMLPEYLPAWRNRPTFFVHYRRGVLEELMALQNVAATVDILSYRAEDQVAVYAITW